jgi:hypothetical protein
MELQIEMVPEPIWGMNLRAPDALGKYRWGKLRKSIIAERGPACAICTSPDQPHGHEIWQYEERRRISIATLHGVEITCRACHQIHHWGLTTRLYMQGAIDKQHVKGLIKHFCKINQCKGRDMKQHADEAMVIWATPVRLAVESRLGRVPGSRHGCEGRACRMGDTDGKGRTIPGAGQVLVLHGVPYHLGRQHCLVFEAGGF